MSTDRSTINFPRSVIKKKLLVPVRLLVRTVIVPFTAATALLRQQDSSDAFVNWFKLR